jgi:ribosomal protein S18 acetylase RimI-like enzyme
MTDSQLTLMRLKPDTSGPVVYKPFSESDDFTDDWWNDTIYGFEPTQHFYSFFNGQHEVARAEVEIQDTVNEDYDQPAHPGPYGVIHFFEVSEEHRRRGYGTEAVQLIADRYEGTPLVAFSQGADTFWASLGWDQHEHQTEPAHYGRMFVSRPR